MEHFKPEAGDSKHNPGSSTSLTMSEIDSRIQNIKLSVELEENEVQVNKILVQNLQRKVDNLEKQVLGYMACPKEPEETEKEELFDGTFAAIQFFDKFEKIFNQLMELEENLCKTTAGLDENQLKVKEWLLKFDRHATKYKSFKSPVNGKEDF